MGLKDYVVPSTEVTLVPSTAKVKVRGLNFVDLTKLLNDHGPVLVMIYGRVWAEIKSGTLDPAKVGEMIQTTLMETPDLVGDIIAIAADEPDAKSHAMTLTPGVQVEIISAVIGHTFVSEAEVKKLVEIVTQMLEKAGDLAMSLTGVAPSTVGSGESDAA